jgi:hypothetical protein
VSVDDLMAALAELQEQGIEAEREPYRRQGRRLADLLRPGPGRLLNDVELTAAGLCPCPGTTATRARTKRGARRKLGAPAKML